MKAALVLMLLLVLSGVGRSACADEAPIVEQEVRFPGGSLAVSLAGTLTLPPAHDSAAGLLPAVLLIHGTGLVDRDETIANHKPFRTIAESLSAAGYAVLRYDKRGAGRSTGPVDTLTLADLAADAEAALDWLRAQPGIDPKRIGLLGHSEGGMIAPMVAGHRPEVAWLVLLGAPTVPGRQLVLYQTAQLMRDRGLGEDEARAAVESAKRLFGIVLREQTPEAREAELTEALEAERDTRHLPAKFVDEQKRSLLTPWFRATLAYDPLPVLKAVKQPVLMLYGELDHQVPPSLNAAPARLALRGRAGSMVKLLPDLNHLLFRAKTGAVSEYATIIGGVDDSALETIRRWLAKQA